ncbi:PqiC family protein [Desulfolithobacter sp.]
MKYFRSLLLFALGLLLLCGQAGCIPRSIPVSQYTLAAQAREPLASTRELPGLLLVGPVQLPPYIDGPGIVTRTGDSRINRSSSHFWAGPLDIMVRDTLTADLARLLDSSLVAPWPGPRFGNPALQVEIILLSFVGEPDAEFTCEAIWSLGDVRTRQMLRRRTFRTVLTLEGSDYTTYALIGSQALHQLALEIARTLTNLDAPGTDQ